MGWLYENNLSHVSKQLFTRCPCGGNPETDYVNLIFYCFSLSFSTNDFCEEYKQNAENTWYVRLFSITEELNRDKCDKTT